MKKLICYLMACLMAFGGIGCTNTSKDKDDGDKGVKRVDDTRNLSDFDFTLMNLAGTDDVGRRIETRDNYKRDTKTVGLFYSLWLGQHKDSQSDIYDINALLSTTEGQNALADTQPNKLSRPNEFHFAGEPLYGYYNMSDPWVVNRHVELLTLAGIDYLCFDATNSILYQRPTFTILDTLLKYQNDGWNVPKAMFYTNSFSGTTAKKIYNDFYQTEKYNSIWWAPNDKPMLVGITENNNNASDQTKYAPAAKPYTDLVSKDLQSFFDVLEAQWPNGDLNYDKGFPWMSWQYPQQVHTGSKTMSVSVAQHSPRRINMSFMDAESSRGFNYLTGKVEQNYWEGKNFQNGWDTAHKNVDQLETVLATGFNEWMAIKTMNQDGYNFCDVYTSEYSRDIEMEKSENKDNFTMQLIENTRKFRLDEGSKKYKWNTLTVDVKNESSLVMWDYAKATYKDFAGDAMARNYENAVGTFNYVDNSNRNDITDIKVAHDKNNMYFYVKTLSDITAYNGTDKNWMNILISTSYDKSGFAGYNYMLNRTPGANGKTTVEKSSGGYNFDSAGQADYAVYGNVLVMAVPLKTLGLSETNYRIEFKVADNVTRPDDIMDYYVTGDSAPLGRLSYSYGK